MIVYKGIVLLNYIKDYWITDSIYGNVLCPKIMSKYRFQNLIKFLYIHTHQNNLNSPKINLQNRISHFSAILKTFRTKFQSFFLLGGKITIDESILLYDGRLIMKQSNPFKNINGE